MAKRFFAPSDVNPYEAGWKGRLVRRDGDDLALAASGATRCVGVCIAVTDRLGGEIAVALPGEEAQLLLGSPIDPATTDLISPDADGAGAPSGVGDRPACVLAQFLGAGAGRTVPVRVLDGLHTI